MTLLTGLTQDGQEVPVQVDGSGRLVAEGLTGPAGPVGPTGPAGPAGSSIDYEEGTFTATLKGGTTDPTTPVTTTAIYTKIGRVVHVQIAFESINTTGAAGNVFITGLPFANRLKRSVCSVMLSFFDLNTGTSVIALIEPASTTISLYASKDDNVWQQVLHKAGEDRYLQIAATYSI